MSILNKQETKKYILETTKGLRPEWGCTQISAAALQQIELKTKMYIRDAIRRHPTVGKTFREFLS